MNDGTVSVLRVTKEVASHKYDRSLVVHSGSGQYVDVLSSGFRIVVFLSAHSCFGSRLTHQYFYQGRPPKRSRPSSRLILGMWSISKVTASPVSSLFVGLQHVQDGKGNRGSKSGTHTHTSTRC